MPTITAGVLAAAIAGFMIGIAISAAVVRCRQFDGYQSQRIRDLSAELIETCDRLLAGYPVEGRPFADHELRLVARTLKTILESGVRP